MTDRDIEDTREPEFEEVDPDAMWERIDDILGEYLRDFIHEEIDRLERKVSNFRRENQTLRNELDPLKTKVAEAIETINEGMGDWTGVEIPYLPTSKWPLKTAKDILERKSK